MILQPKDFITESEIWAEHLTLVTKSLNIPSSFPLFVLLTKTRTDVQMRPTVALLQSALL